MRTIFTKLATASIATIALVAGAAGFADAKTGDLAIGRPGTDGALTVTVTRTFTPEPHASGFQVTTCLAASAKPTTIKASDFTVINDKGTRFPSTWAENEEQPYPSPAGRELLLQPGDCATGRLVSWDLGSAPTAIEYKAGLLRWAVPQYVPPTFTLGEVADAGHGMKVTLSNLRYRGNGMWFVDVKMCSPVPMYFSWTSIRFVELTTGDKRVVGNHEGDVLGAKALPYENDIKAGGCASGTVSLVTTHGIKSFEVLDATIIANAPVPTSGKPTLPKTGN